MSELQKIKPEFFQPIKDKFSQAGISEEVFTSEISFAVQAIRKSDYLQKADPQTVLAAVLNVAQCGLTLNPIRKEAYLVGRYDSRTRRIECHLEPSYIGLAKSVTDTGAVTSINCQVVYEGDGFEFNMADANPVKKHVPAYLTGKERGKPVACYSLATLKDGTIHVEIAPVEGKDGIYETSRRRSESWKKYEKAQTPEQAEKLSKYCVWITDEEQMIRKATIKRHTSKLPRTKSWDKVDKIVDLDNEDYSVEASQDQISYIETLLDRIEYLLESGDLNHVFTYQDHQSISNHLTSGISVDEAENYTDELRGILSDFYNDKLHNLGLDIGSVLERDGKPIKIKYTTIDGAVKGVYLNEDLLEMKKKATLTFEELAFSQQ